MTDSELRKQLEDFELEGVVTHRRAGSFKDTYIFTVADVNRLEALIASQVTAAEKRGAENERNKLLDELKE